MGDNSVGRDISVGGSNPPLPYGVRQKSRSGKLASLSQSLILLPVTLSTGSIWAGRRYHPHGRGGYITGASPVPAKRCETVPCGSR